MRIAYHIVGSTAGYAALMDEALGGVIEPWEPDFTAHQQIEELASNAGQGASVFTNPLGNARVTIPLHNMVVPYATSDLAFAASNDIPLIFLANKIHLQVTQGSQTRYYPNAVFSRCKPSVKGSIIVWQMDCVTQMAQKSQPAN